MDVTPIAEVQELFASELSAVVGDDDVGNPKPVDDVSEKRTACSERMLVMGRASIHLENLSMATNKWVYPPFAFCRGPTKSSPHTANGHVMGIIWRSWVGRCVFLA